MVCIFCWLLFRYCTNLWNCFRVIRLTFSLQFLGRYVVSTGKYLLKFRSNVCLHLQFQAVHEHPIQTIMDFESPSSHFTELRFSHKPNDLFFKRRWTLEFFLSHQYNLVRDIQAFFTFKEAP